MSDCFLLHVVPDVFFNPRKIPQCSNPGLLLHVHCVPLTAISASTLPISPLTVELHDRSRYMGAPRVRLQCKLAVRHQSTLPWTILIFHWCRSAWSVKNKATAQAPTCIRVSGAAVHPSHRGGLGRKRKQKRNRGGQPRDDYPTKAFHLEKFGVHSVLLLKEQVMTSKGRTECDQPSMVMWIHSRGSIQKVELYDDRHHH